MDLRLCMNVCTRCTCVCVCVCMREKEKLKLLRSWKTFLRFSFWVFHRIILVKWFLSLWGGLSDMQVFFLFVFSTIPFHTRRLVDTFGPFQRKSLSKTFSSANYFYYIYSDIHVPLFDFLFSFCQRNSYFYTKIKIHFLEEMAFPWSVNLGLLLPENL